MVFNLSVCSTYCCGEISRKIQII